MTPAEPAPGRGHTPGKWEARGDHVGVWHRYKSGVKDMIHFVALASVSIPRRRKEVRSYHEGVAEMSANARLIAAAPDLLDSLDWIVTFASEHPEWFGDGKPEEGAEFEWLASARALLAAVRGQP